MISLALALAQVQIEPIQVPPLRNIYQASAIQSGLLTDNDFDGGGKSYTGAGAPLVIENRDANLSNFTYDGEIWLGSGSFNVTNVECKGFRLSGVTGANLTRIRTDGAEYGVALIGGNNVTVKDSHFKNHRIGMVILPGDPHTHKLEAEARGIAWKEGNQWIPGTNLGGMIRSTDGVYFTGNGTTSARIAFTWPEGPFWKTDPRLPMKDNYYTVAGKRVQWVSDDANGVNIQSNDGVFELGKTYWLHTYNPKYEVKGIRIIGNTFENCHVAGVSAFFIAGSLIQDNIVWGSPDDYEIGLEHARDCRIENNIGFLAPGGDVRVRIGLLLGVENVTIKGNNMPIHYNAKNEPEVNLVTDSPVKYVGSRSPWVK